MKVLFAALLTLLPGFSAMAREPFIIKMVDEVTGRGVPMLKLTIVHKVIYITDNAGVFVFDEPDLMYRPGLFMVSSHG